MGLALQNPFIVSSSGLTQDARGIERAAQAGAGAIVVKSLFEEQIQSELAEEMDLGDVASHPEAEQYLAQMGKQIGPREYLDLVRTAKKRVAIPIIASVNCVTAKWWTGWARQIEDVGADALELNIAIMPRGLDERAAAVEARFGAIVSAVTAAVRIPVAVKLGPFFSALPALARSLVQAGARSLVLFNRFYQMDIDIDGLRLAAGNRLSTSNEIYQPLRWTSILAGQIGCEICTSTGLHEAADAVKLLLAGATGLGVCSVLYEKGYEHVGALARGLSDWMKKKGFQTIAEFRGRLAQAASPEPERYERLQYIKALTGVS